MTDTRRRAVIVRSFTDEGTGKSYTAGSTRMIAEGAFANYEAAGLVRAPEPRPAPKPKPSTPSKAKARPAPDSPAVPAPPAAPASGDDGASA